LHSRMIRRVPLSRSKIIPTRRSAGAKRLTQCPSARGLCGHCFSRRS
jgi:hypothetical protein